MSLIHIIILAVVQGLAELLPVSSSAHVVVTEKLLGLDPSSPPMTLLLVMLHTGTMFAVILYFWKQWRQAYFESAEKFKRAAVLVILATFLTGIVGETIIKVVEKTAFRGVAHAEIENLFGRLDLIAPALAVAGILILIAGLATKHSSTASPAETAEISFGQASLIGAVQGLCLPFRGFSRSGATISTGMLAGASKISAEAFSFALAVILTPPVIAREVLRLMHAQHAAGGSSLSSAVVPSLLGAVFSFLAGLLALKWLSQWLEKGRWYVFGIYCLAAAVAVYALYRAGY
jgi:undecaprenyl-diphosphatase